MRCGSRSQIEEGEQGNKGASQWVLSWSLTRGGEVSTGGQEGWAEVGRFTFRKEETGVCGSQSRGWGDIGKREASAEEGRGWVEVSELKR